MKRIALSIIAAALPFGISWLGGMNLNERGEGLAFTAITALIWAAFAWAHSEPGPHRGTDNAGPR